MLAAAILASGAVRAQQTIAKTGDRLTLGPAQLKMDNSKVVEDAAGLEGRALESGGKRWYIVHRHTPYVPAGRYRVTARVKVLRRDAPKLVGRFTVNADSLPSLWDVSIPFGTESFAKADQYRDFSIELVRPPSKQGTFRLFVRIKHTDADVALRVACVTIEALAIAPVYVHKVWPARILAKCNSDQPITVAVSNTTDQAQKGLTARLELVRGLGEVLRVGDTPLDLAPFETREIVVPWKAGDREYGCEARATVLAADGKVRSSHSDYFAVSRSHFKLRINATPRNSGWYLDKKAKVRGVMELRLNYGNYVEVYGWPPSAFVELYPRRRFWVSGQVCAWQYDRDVMEAWIAEMHRLGLFVTSYNISLFNGWPGMEWMRKHPEWCSFSEKGRPAGGVNTALWKTEANAYNDEKPPERLPFTGEMPNSGSVWPMNDELMRHGANEIVLIHDKLGFDGMRWDGHPLVYVTKKEGAIAGTEFGKMVWNHEGKRIVDVVPNGDLDAQSLHNIQLIKGIVRKAAPDFEWGYNAGYDLTAEQQPRTWREVVQGAGIWVEGGFRSGDEGRADPTNTWAKYMDKLWLSCQFVIRNGGYPIHGALAADSMVMRQFLNALFLIQGSHVCWHGGSWGEFHRHSRFATRYCGYLFDPRIRPWWGRPDIHVTGWVQWEDRNADKTPPIEEEARIAAPGRLFHPERMLFHRELSDTRKETILHLLNHPGKPYVDYTEIDAAPVQENIVVSLRVPAGMQAREAWRLSADAWPMERKLPVASADPGWVKVTVPRLESWDILVVSWGKEG